MFRKLLVPLDGSKLAECALPYAEELAQELRIDEIILVSVTERTRGQRPLEEPTATGELRMVTEAVGKKQNQAQRYLNRIARRLEAKGIKVRTQVLLWPPAEAIVAYAEQFRVDLIVMASHGRSGPSRWAYGSVADKVSRASCIPVLMIKAPGCVPGI